MRIPKGPRRKAIQLLLFLLTVIATTLAGVEWIAGRFPFGEDTTIEHYLMGFRYSVLFLGILTVHEFGHYLTARWYGIRVTLPYYIPFYLGFIGLPFSLGTMGAFIRIEEAIRSRREYFDVGVAGPLAGFVAALVVLTYGFTHLPPPEYVFEIHPDWAQYGLDYPKYVYQDQPFSFWLGTNLLFEFFKEFVADPARLPNPHELMHYPWLFAGYLALFFTSLNLLPIGQLDGGHILYGLLGEKRHRMVSSVLFLLLITYAGLGFVSPYDPLDELLSWGAFHLGLLVFMCRPLSANLKTAIMLGMSVFTLQFLAVYMMPTLEGYYGWTVFGVLLSRVLGLFHPPVLIDRPLSKGRKVLGYVSLFVFAISFSPRPFNYEIDEDALAAPQQQEEGEPDGPQVFEEQAYGVSKEHNGLSVYER